MINRSSDLQDAQDLTPNFKRRGADALVRRHRSPLPERGIGGGSSRRLRAR
jgi:hypothetical protein